MSYENMARSHIKELFREAFDLTEVVIDQDGDLPFTSGAAVFYVSVVGGGGLIRVWSCAVHGLAVTKPVLREVNDANASLVLARSWVQGSGVMVEGWCCMSAPRAGPQTCDRSQGRRTAGTMNRPAAHSGTRWSAMPKGSLRRSRPRGRRTRCAWSS